MKHIFHLLAVALLFGSCSADVVVSHQDKSAYTITTSPAETNETQMNFSWATDTTITEATLEVTKVNDKGWKKSVSQTFKGVLCTTFDSVYSKTHDGKDFYEDVVINKYNATVTGLVPDTRYKYRVITTDTSSVHYFHTAGARNWEACIISDFHVYSPLYGRTQSAMDMIATVENYKPFDWILHLGDITAWGGSYTFWKDLYKEAPFPKYMWAGVNGNHDNMTRGYHQTTNKFFRDAAAYPRNGYPGEEGVCYHFRYGDVLFIMLNNENMRDSSGLAAAQQWVREVVAQNPAPYKVVCEHYQWFFGKDGSTSQYGRWCKLFDELGVDALVATTVSHMSYRGDGCSDSSFFVEVIGAEFGDDAVAIEGCLGEDGGAVLGLGEGDNGTLLAEVGEDLLGRVVEALTVGILLVELLDVDVVGTLDEQVGILDGCSHPLRCGDDVVHTDAAIIVRINVLETLLVDLQSCRGT